MYEATIPGRHTDPWVDLLRGYATQTVEALLKGGLLVKRSWLDPCDPRDFTITYSLRTGGAPMGLVWDEVTGWRRGPYLRGQQGVRTELADVSYLGGGVLPDPKEVARRAVTGVSMPHRKYRSYNDLRDGLDDALRHESSRLRLMR